MNIFCGPALVPGPEVEKHWAKQNFGRIRLKLFLHSSKADPNMHLGLSCNKLELRASLINTKWHSRWEGQPLLTALP